MQSKRLSDFLISRSNNLGVIKFVAALLVIVSHSYPLSLGNEYNDILATISKESIGLGSLAVSIFFFSSGLFLTRSILKKPSAKKYLASRIKRIFPPLILVVIVTIFISGFFLSNYSFQEFFSNTQTYKYMLNGLLIPIHDLPGVFVNNIYGPVVNGALWTLPIEFICYIILLILMKMNLLNLKYCKYLLPIAILVFLIIFYIPIPLLSSIKGYLLPMFSFFMGSAYLLFSDRIVMYFKYFFASIILFIIFVFCGYGEISLFLFFPYILCYLCFFIPQCSNNLGKIGNLSYGIYLCAFPVQQCMVFINGGSMNVLTNQILSIPLSILIGYAIYFISERPFYNNH